MDYKVSRFTNLLKKDEYILHNTLSNAAIRVYEDMHMKIIDNLIKKGIFDYDEEKEIDPQFFETLKENNIIVGEHEDEMATLNSMHYDYENNGSLSLTLMVTRKCNFECPYCFETSANKVMSKEVYDKVIEYIIYKIENENIKEVSVTFFGGEPTLESKNIIEFMNELNSKNEKLYRPAYIHGGIITNGYLLIPSVIDQMLEANMNFFQITVDGFAETHNKSRILSGGAGSWDKIIENMIYLKQKKEDFTVQIRGNITPEMFQNIDSWLKYIKDNFGDDDRFFAHFETAKDLGTMKDDSLELCEDESDVLEKVINKAKKIGVALDMSSSKTEPFSMVCYSTKKNALVVDYDGSIRRCTGSVLDYPINCCGNIMKEMTVEDYKATAAWTSYELLDACYNCDILPLCYGRKCPVGSVDEKYCNKMINVYYSELEYLYGKKN